MKDIFTDLYKKVLGFFQAQEKETTKEDGSKNVATNRLKLVLMQDRTNLTPYLLERMRGEMIDVLSKYVEMDQDELELNFEQDGDSMALMLSIPVLRAKDEEEIQAIIKAEEEAKKAAEESEETKKLEAEIETSEEVEEESSEEIENSDEETEAESESEPKDESGLEEIIEKELAQKALEEKAEVPEKKSKKKK